MSEANVNTETTEENHANSQSGENGENQERFKGSGNTSNSYFFFGGVLSGRREVNTTVRKVTPQNVLEVLSQAVQTHNLNEAEIRYLYRYYKGIQPIVNRVKEIRPEINNKIVENRAFEIVQFKTGYLFGDPITYTGRGNEGLTDDVKQLNVYMADVDKESKDVELSDWMHICGVGYRFIFPNADRDEEDNPSPFIIETLDPQNTFVVWYNGTPKVPVMGVHYVSVDDTPNKYLYTVYTTDMVYEIMDGEIISMEKNGIGAIPIIEYQLNQARIGAFEIVIALLDGINLVSSNRLDGLEQYIQAIILFHNVDVDSKDVEKLQAMGAIKYKDADSTMQGEVKYITAELNQEGVQKLKDDLYESVLTICGMPNRNSGNGDNGVAVVYRDGWSAAEVSAKQTEKRFIRTEKDMLKVALKICRTVRNSKVNLHLSDIDVKPTRRNYDNISTKSTVLTTMLSSDKIAPRLAFVSSGMFTDPDAAYAESVKYYEEHREEIERENLSAVRGNNTGDSEGSEQGRSSGSEDRTRGTSGNSD